MTAQAAKGLVPSEAVISALENLINSGTDNLLIAARKASLAVEASIAAGDKVLSAALSTAKAAKAADANISAADLLAAAKNNVAGNYRIEVNKQLGSLSKDGVTLDNIDNFTNEFAL